MAITLQDVVNTLNQVQVMGKENMDRLLGAILVLESMINQREEGGEGENG